MIGAIIGGIAALGSAIAGSVSSRKNTNKALSAQKSEQESNRQYNMELAQKENQWNIQQWQRENEYNKPSSMLARGVNPDLAYGGGASAMSASSPKMTSGAPSTPVDYSPIANRKSTGQNMLEAASISLAASQTAKIQAETKQIETQTEGQKSTNILLATDAQFREQINSGTVQLQSAQIQGTWATTDEKNTNIFLMRKQMENLEKLSNEIIVRTEHLKSQISETDSKTQLNKINANLATPLAKASIANLAASANLSIEQAHRLVMTNAATLLGLNLQNEQTAQGTLNMSISGEQLEFNLGSDKQWRSFERVAKPLVEVSQAVAIGLGLRNGKSAPTVKGYK